MKSKTLAVAVAGAVVLGLTAVPSMAGVMPYDNDDPSVSAWSSHCDSTQYAAYDPIVHRDGSATHVHEFFAPIAMTESTTPYDLRRQNSIDCMSASPPNVITGGCLHPNPPGPYYSEVCDKSAYWVPELVDNSDPQNLKRIVPAYALTYFRNEYLDPAAIQGFDKELSMVAGDQAATTPQPSYVVKWACVAGDTQYYRDDGKLSLMPDSCDLTYNQRQNNKSLFLRMVVTFPNCIDPGTVQANGLEVPDNVFYSESNGHPPGQWDTCPSSGVPTYISMPTLQVGARWKLETQLSHSGGAQATWTFDLSNLWLVSDLAMMGAVPDIKRGTTAHADFMSGWKQNDIDGLIAQCFHSAQLNCGNVGGNGT